MPDLPHFLQGFKASLLSDCQSLLGSCPPRQPVSPLASPFLTSSTFPTGPLASTTLPPAPSSNSYPIRRDSWRRKGILGCVLTIPFGPNLVLDYLRAEIDTTLSSDMVKLPLFAQIDSIFAMLSHLQPLVCSNPSTLSWAATLIDDAFSPCQRAAEAITFYLQSAHHYTSAFASEYYKILEGHSGSFTPAETMTKRCSVKSWVPRKRTSVERDFRSRDSHSKDPPQTRFRERSNEPRRAAPKSPSEY